MGRWFYTPSDISGHGTSSEWSRRSSCAKGSGVVNNRVLGWLGVKYTSYAATFNSAVFVLFSESIIAIMKLLRLGASQTLKICLSISIGRFSNFMATFRCVLH